jgi:hypothetical protein
LDTKVLQVQQDPKALQEEVVEELQEPLVQLALREHKAKLVQLEEMEGYLCI